MLKRQDRQASHIKKLDQMIKSYQQISEHSKCIKRKCLKTLARWPKNFQRNSERLINLAEADDKICEGYKKISESTMDKYEEFRKMILSDSYRIHASKVLKNTFTEEKIERTNINKSKAQNASHKRKANKRSKTPEGPAAKRLESGNRSIIAGNY